MLSIHLKKLDPNAVVPQYARLNDAGMDLVACKDLTIEPGERGVVNTGIAIAIPSGYGGFVQPRSGLAVKKGVTVLNSPGLIDPGYRGEIMVALLNTDKHQAFEIKRGERIAQLVVKRVEHVVFEETIDLPSEEAVDGGLAVRGAGGFGHSGV